MDKVNIAEKAKFMINFIVGILSGFSSSNSWLVKVTRDELFDYKTTIEGLLLEIETWKKLHGGEAKVAEQHYDSATQWRRDYDRVSDLLIIKEEKISELEKQLDAHIRNDKFVTREYMNAHIRNMKSVVDEALRLRGESEDKLLKAHNYKIAYQNLKEAISKQLAATKHIVELVGDSKNDLH